MRLIKVIVLSVLLLASFMHAAAKPREILSPGRTLGVVVDPCNLSFSLRSNGEEIMRMSDIALKLDKATLSGEKHYRSFSTRTVEERIHRLVSLKQQDVLSRYTQILISYSGYDFELRLYDEALAYRFITRGDGEVEVMDECFCLSVDSLKEVHRQPTGGFMTSFEEEYKHEPLDAWEQSQRPLTTSPVLFSRGEDRQLLFAETDVTDYPKMFLEVKDGYVVPRFPRATLEWTIAGDRAQNITREAQYIARTKRSREFPWRYFVLGSSRSLLEQTLSMQLSRESAIADCSWIRPGKVSWEWWNGAVPYGEDVTFQAGNNFETYAYFADFAAKYGIDYILLDEGWAKSVAEPFEGKDELRLEELISYCRKRGVGVFLWLTWNAVHFHPEVFAQYEKWGVSGIKVDFMDHADQWMGNYCRSVARMAAEHHLLLDLHGVYTPSGLEYEYPNLLSYEGVRGMEYMQYCTPQNTMYVPFIRNAVGAADFTPGAMLNYQPEQYHADRPNSGAMGTRCYQMALYVVLESAIQMLADNPSLYIRNDRCTRFISGVPVTWDQTVCLDARVGEYAVFARRKGERWYLGAITLQERELELDLGFLGDGESVMEAFRDGVNANRQAMHYTYSRERVNPGVPLKVKLARNGGFAAVIEKN